MERAELVNAAFSPSLMHLYEMGPNIKYNHGHFLYDETIVQTFM